jgi:hypothetical protein
MDSTYQIVKEAILDKHSISAFYNGFQREMCPHAIGTKKGIPQALFYQFGGESSSGLAPAGSPDNWRCITLSKLSGVRSDQGEWHTAPNHSRPNTCMDQIDVEVRY